MKATESFLGLDEDVRGCQIKETYSQCTTRIYKETALEQCGCLPKPISFLSGVYNKHFFVSLFIIDLAVFQGSLMHSRKDELHKKFKTNV